MQPAWQRSGPVRRVGSARRVRCFAYLSWLVGRGSCASLPLCYRARPHPRPLRGAGGRRCYGHVAVLVVVAHVAAVAHAIASFAIVRMSFGVLFRVRLKKIFV